MAWEQPGFSITLVAAADLSTTGQFLFVKLDSSSNVVLCAAVTDKPVGVLQNSPSNVGSTGQEALVMVEGITKMVAGATIAIDDLLGTDGSGKAVPYVPGTDTTKYLVGRALEAASANEVFTMLFSCMGVGGNRGA